MKHCVSLPRALALLALATVGLTHLGHTRLCAAEEGPVAALSAILGRPTVDSIAVSVLSATALEARLEYGPQNEGLTQRTAAQPLRAGQPADFTLEALRPDTRYRYRLLTRAAGAAETETRIGLESTFHTARAPGRSFAFGVQGDSHPERDGRMFAAPLYARTLRNVAADMLDFYVTMGDDFSIERLIGRRDLSQTAVDRVYSHQRSFLGLVGHSAALFLVNGNHEQAALANLDGRPDNAATLAARARNRFFPLPEPDAFYGGNPEVLSHVGRLRDYYSWTWGDALFVVIDPYWHTPVHVDNTPGGQGGQRGEGNKGGKGGQSGKGDGGAGRGADNARTRGDGRGRDLWAVTLGDAQYQWLTRTLLESRARWKFVFCHHVLGTGRGGVELARLYEWGGHDRQGAHRFAEKRPGWPLPIHALMVKAGVTIFFQGHDHLYASQELEGVVYQTCPNPADPTYQAFNRDAYRSGTVHPNSGHLRVTVEPSGVQVEYVRAFLSSDEKPGRSNGTAAHAYRILPREQP